MQYRINKKNGDKLSALGYGCMRFASLTDGSAEEALKYAIEHGVNYFDTAYIYDKGKSEELLGKFLDEGGYRKSVKVATKLPQYLVKKYADFDKFFNIQKTRLRTDYIDYYLLHNLGEYADWTRLESLGVRDWISEKKKSGEIINIGFSFHGQCDEFMKIIDAYDWDFTMIQYNFFDEYNQAGKRGLEYADSKGIPIMIMEPLRGGGIVKDQSKVIMDKWASAKPKRTVVDWCLRWVYNHSEPLVVLSGMNNKEQLIQNLETVETALPSSLTESELAVFESIRLEMMKSFRVICTGCRYCMPCPKGVNIPSCFNLLNQKSSMNIKNIRFKYIGWMALFSDTPGIASQCVSCGQCVKKCPQHIDIPAMLKIAKKELELPGIQFIRKVGRLALKKNKK